MPTLVMLLVVFGLTMAFWSAGRAAAERAVAVGRNACQAAGVQLLDHTVHARGLRLRRGPDGWLGLERIFRFEYSEDGVERHIGQLVLFRGQLVAFSGPPRSTNVITLN
ncbi:MAG TPA: DUF3301 domain-containing protein [Lysobacter sp.]|nr:DUF3301 domain-containing protein [Lysobacter sp.]